MEDTLIVIFTIIVSVLLMFIFPLMDTWERQDDLSYMYVYSLVTDFADTVRNTGRLTKDMLEQFENDLFATGNTYDIQLEHRKYITECNDYLYIFNNEIQEHLENNDYTDFSKGDYFYVSVKNTNKTQSTLVKEFIYSSDLETFKIGVPYGGMIRNEY